VIPGVAARTKTNSGAGEKEAEIERGWAEGGYRGNQKTLGGG
jgi:hypothetical protein